MGFQLQIAPAVEPVTLAQAKNYARITTTAEDDIVSGLITTARELCETYTNKKFVFQKWRMYLDAFPGYIDQRLGGNIVSTPIAIGATSYMAGIRWAIVPEWPPVRGVDALSYLDPNSDPVTMTENVDYIVDKISKPARISPMFGKFWPISRIQTNSVWIDWTSGWGGPLTVSIAESSQTLQVVAAAGSGFYQSDVGAAITIPGAGTPGGSPVMPTDLVTTIASVDSNGVATLTAAAGATVTDASIWWGATIPQAIQTAIMQLVSTWYNTRETLTATKLLAMPFGMERLLSPYRDVRV